MLELIEQQGLDVLLLYLTKVKQDARKKTSSKAVKILASDHRINQIYIELKKNEDLSPEQLIHPKFYVLEKLLLQEIKNNPNSRVLVFVKLRASVKNIVNKLKMNSPEILRPARFVGQATKSKDDKGLSQKKQLEILEQFKQGQYNILVSTNVGEEGLDIAECDLVIFYDVVASEVRFIQRKGRTARHREGKVIILYCKGTHDEIYMHIALNKLNKMNVNLKSGQQLRSSYTKAPKEMIADESSLVKIPSESTTKVEVPQKQGTLQAFLQNPSNSKEKTQKSVEIRISLSLPVKFGIRKKLQNDQIPFEIVKSIIHINLFDRVIIQSLDPHQFEEESLLKKISHLSKKYGLIVSIFDFVNFSEKFQDEERLLKQKIKDWGLKNDLQAISIDLPEELYFIVKNIYLHSKKEFKGA